jgi:hypothetical protein
VKNPALRIFDGANQRPRQHLCSSHLRLQRAGGGDKQNTYAHGRIPLRVWVMSRSLQSTFVLVALRADPARPVILVVGVTASS